MLWPVQELGDRDGEIGRTFHGTLKNLDAVLDEVLRLLEDCFEPGQYRVHIDAVNVLEDAAGRSWFGGLPTLGSGSPDGVEQVLHWLRRAKELTGLKLTVCPEALAPWPLPNQLSDPWIAMAQVSAAVPEDVEGLLASGDSAWRLPCTRMWSLIRLLSEVIAGFQGVSSRSFGFNRVVGTPPDPLPKWPDLGQAQAAWPDLVERLSARAASTGFGQLAVLLKLHLALAEPHEDELGGIGFRLLGSPAEAAENRYRLARLWAAFNPDDLAVMVTDGLRDAALMLEPGAREQSERAVSTFSWPEGVERKWSNLRIALERGSAWIAAGDCRSKKYSHKDMGFEDRKERKPNRRWLDLWELARREDGIPLPADRGPERSRLHNRFSVTRRTLKAFFGIDDQDPFLDVAEMGAYRPRFTLLLREYPSIPVPAGTTWEHISIGLDGDQTLVFEVPATVSDGEETRTEARNTNVAQDCRRYSREDLAAQRGF
ncbi:MAG: hypothetical protein WBF17_06890 [Phycisphaerae bacterium]